MAIFMFVEFTFQMCSLSFSFLSLVMQHVLMESAEQAAERKTGKYVVCEKKQKTKALLVTGLTHCRSLMISL